MPEAEALPYLFQTGACDGLGFRYFNGSGLGDKAGFSSDPILVEGVGRGVRPAEPCLRKDVNVI